MNKLSNAQLAEVLTDSATTLRSQQATINELQDKLAARDSRDRVEKIAGEMHRKGLELDTSVELLADRLEKHAASKLDAIEQGVELVGPDMGTKLASLISDNPGASAGSSSDLERFIVGGVG